MSIQGQKKALEKLSSLTQVEVFCLIVLQLILQLVFSWSMYWKGYSLDYRCEQTDNLSLDVMTSLNNYVSWF